jgi:hypothetical protein
LEKTIANYKNYWNSMVSAHKQVANNYYNSALTRNCIKSGKSLDEGGSLINNNTAILSSGMTNVANFLAGIEALLKDKTCSMDIIREALSKNWVGYENLQKNAISAPKWGNNEDNVDNRCTELFNEYCKIVGKQENIFGEAYDPSILSLQNNSNLGCMAYATPDGKSTGSPAFNLKPNEMTDILKSSHKLELTKLRGGPLSFVFNPSNYEGAEGSKKLLLLIDSYFKNNGNQIQFNAIDVNILKDAQKEPQKYKDLMVSDSGLAYIFVELDKPAQNELIAKFEQLLASEAHYDLHTQPSSDVSDANEAISADIKEMQHNRRIMIDMYSEENSKFQSYTANGLFKEIKKRMDQHAFNEGITLNGDELLRIPEYYGQLISLAKQSGAQIGIEMKKVWPKDQYIYSMLRQLDFIIIQLSMNTTLASVQEISAEFAPKIVASVSINGEINNDAVAELARSLNSMGIDKMRLVSANKLSTHKLALQQLGLIAKKAGIKDIQTEAI